MSKQCTSNRGIIMIPYAYLVNSNTGVNIANRSKQVDIYMKNCCVACLSAKKYNDSDTDVALVTNIDPPKEYRDILESHKIKIIYADFDLFNFSGEYTWALAFYKLCALHHILHEYDYDYYAYLDSDVFIQASFKSIWTECDAHILLYDINHGLQVKDYQHILSEMQDFMPSLFNGGGNMPTHYGGEFFAANRANAMTFIKDCKDIYTEMCQQEFTTTHGDEFITSIAANKLGPLVKNAGAYIYRFWTGTFRLISTCYKYNPVVILHVPAEKEIGMLALYDKYIKYGELPNNTKIYKLLHLTHPSLKTRITQFIKQFKH